MATMPVGIKRERDGRHTLTDADGNVLGRHNSVWSAARQLHDYYGGSSSDQPATSADAELKPVEPGDVEPAMEAVEAKGVGAKQSAIMERPKIPKPPKDRPSIPKPRIPKP